MSDNSARASNLTDNMTRQHEEAIKQLQDTTTLHQQAINSMQTDITTMKIAINDIIRFTSEIATKLGFEITLPPPLPLSPTSPTSLPATAAAPIATDILLLSPIPPSTLNATAASSMTAAPPLHQPSAPAPISTIVASFLHQPSLSTMAPSSSIKQYDSSHKILKSFSDSHIQFLVGIPDTLHAISWKQQLKIALNPTWPNEQELAEQELVDAHNAFVEMNKPPRESKIIIFDPGGTINIASIFDLEDKVDFERSVMIRCSQLMQQLAPLHMLLDLNVQYRSQLDI